ncbi:FAD:protein FMN transferase [Neorhizobium galegae]|uniref:FAD:protein FMN transferase n=1 Tax=Neorhizobium galegae TaxID=399 RepID=UPI00351CEBED
MEVGTGNSSTLIHRTLVRNDQLDRRLRYPTSYWWRLIKTLTCGESRFDLNGIAKGYGVDRLTEAARELGIEAGLFGELRALGTQPPETAAAVREP